MRAGQNKRRLAVIECRRLPAIRRVAVRATLAELVGPVIRIRRLIIRPLMARPAVRWQGEYSLKGRRYDASRYGR